MKRIVEPVAVLALLLLLPVCSLRAQDEERIEALFQGALEALGGDAFLQVKDIVSEGSYFMFNREGDSSTLIKYNDYTKLPDKSRYELGNRKKERDITVFNLGNKEGWILEGQKETRAATPEEMESFENAIKHSIETIFRFRYKDPENKLFYLGPGERGDMTREIVKLLDPDNDEVVIYFDRASKLPVKIEYYTVDKLGNRLRHVDEFSQWHRIQGVNTPMRIESFINGRKHSQQFPLKLTYNNNLPDGFFSKPVPPK